jgi:hypothetical protein
MLPGTLPLVLPESHIRRGRAVAVVYCRYIELVTIVCKANMGTGGHHLEKGWFITSIAREFYGRSIDNGVYKPTFNWVTPRCKMYFIMFEGGL